MNHIEALRISLLGLQEVFTKYETQFPRREWHNDPYAADTAESLWPRLTGDFYQTLKDCEALLSRHGHLQHGRATAASNLRWWLSGGAEADNLLAKLRFHITKVDFYAKPREFDALVRNGNQLQQMRRQIANLERLLISGPGSSPNLWDSIVSKDLKAKFEAEIQACPPEWLNDGSAWPLEPGFKALAFHFARGTIHFNPTPQSGNVPTLQQYLNLAKSTWILEKLKESHHFKAASTESVWADLMRELEDDLRGQLHRFESGELQEPPAHRLLVLPSNDYAISQSEEANADPLDAGEKGEIGDKILEIDLSPTTGNRECTLLVYREGDADADADFNLVVSMRQADTLVAVHDREIELNMTRNRLVPEYASPGHGLSPPHKILLFDEKGRKAKPFAFGSKEDAQKLQRALTGYRVHHEMPVARWCINGSKDFGHSGQGKLQLWQYKPLPALVEPSLSDGSETSSLLRTPTSPSQTGGSVDHLGWTASPTTPFPDLFHGGTSLKTPSLRTPSLASEKFWEAQDLGRRNTDMSASTVKAGFGRPSGYRRFSKTSTFASTSTSESRSTQRPFSITTDRTTASRASGMKPVRGPRGKGTELVKAELPALVLYTECNSRYTFLHLTRKLHSTDLLDAKQSRTNFAVSGPRNLRESSGV